MPEFHIGWRAEGVLTVDAACWEKACEIADDRLANYTAAVEVDDLDLFPREAP